MAFRGEFRGAPDKLATHLSVCVEQNDVQREPGSVQPTTNPCSKQKQTQHKPRRSRHIDVRATEAAQDGGRGDSKDAPPRRTVPAAAQPCASVVPQDAQGVKQAAGEPDTGSIAAGEGEARAVRDDTGQKCRRKKRRRLARDAAARDGEAAACAAHERSQRAGAAAEQCTGQGAAGEGAEPAHGSRSASATDAKPGGRGQRASGAVGPAACEAADAEAAAAAQAAMHAAGACKVQAQAPCAVDVAETGGRFEAPGAAAGADGDAAVRDGGVNGMRQGGSDGGGHRDEAGRRQVAAQAAPAGASDEAENRGRGAGGEEATPARAEAMCEPPCMPPCAGPAPLTRRATAMAESIRRC